MVHVAQCRPVLRRLLAEGGGGVVIRDHNTHRIFHHPVLHRPAGRLPWPMSLMQPHLIEYTVHAGNNFEDPNWSERTAAFLQDWQYQKKSQIDQAIGDFLKTMNPDDVVFLEQFY